MEQDKLDTLKALERLIESFVADMKARQEFVVQVYDVAHRFSQELTELTSRAWTLMDEEQRKLMGKP